ncbi:MAG TPA: aminomethyl-transferring glycine dehydrogenase subunit GcvPA [Clostridia bacterium]|jgi:glycine dehydrogenase subunit 1|nr:aminomethyl-transferring glycine dehydrogenase subunit GcvPA [Clostridia bacterium]
MSNYVPHTEEDIKSMLKAIGVKSTIELYSDVPKKLLLKELNIPKGITQQEVLEFMQKLADENTVYKAVLRGAGSYRHFIPSVVKNLSSRAEFVTAYTPYQAEMSQGILQVIFEYQTMICNLTGLEVSNASVYNGASAAAEGILMCRERNKSKAIILGNIRPDTRATITTYTEDLGLEIIDIAFDEDLQGLKEALDDQVACVYVEQPGYYGQIIDAKKVGDVVKESGAKYIMGCNPISLAILKSPGECGADIAVGDAQPLGLPLGFGGPYLGFMACTEKMMRKIPGRIVGETVDAEGKKAYVLTLQAREQHIRRERALSNICSNQALCALTATIYLSAVGKQGLIDVANECVNLSHYFKNELSKVQGVEFVEGEFFHEFVTITPGKADIILSELNKVNILGGLKLDRDRILWCVTETVSKECLDLVVDLIRGLV